MGARGCGGWKGGQIVASVFLVRTLMIARGAGSLDREEILCGMWHARWSEAAGVR